ncbi:CDC27 protein [Lithohypha guttulata]|nr:CDC27 protein [Lithohypha guttulata]
MAPDFKTYLSTEILSEQRTVSYRVLSRALKVHVNAAKCMLFEFHKKENHKKAGSVYATYLISGIKKNRVLAGDENATPQESGKNTAVLSDSFLPSSSMPEASQATERLDERYQVPIKTITLCREEDLDAVKSQFEKITSIHVYALSPSHYHAKQDPLIHNKDYGTIQNPHVKRRPGKRPIDVDILQPKPLSKVEPAKLDDVKPVSKPSAKKEETPTVTSRPGSKGSTTTDNSTSKPKPGLRRDGSSLFKAFAKQSAKPKLERKDTSTSAGSDAKMGGMDDNDEGVSEDEAVFLDTGTTNVKKRPTSEIRKEKDERQAKLRKMMEDDAEECEVPRVADATDMQAEPPAAKSNEDPDAPDGDSGQVDWPDSDTEGKHKQPEQDDHGPKRRRGKRKVMKKKTVKDEEGFLVTREEEAWESFSEDEPEPVPAKKSALPPSKVMAAKNQPQKSFAPKTNAGAGGKKKDIMSFFGKK